MASADGAAATIATEFTEAIAAGLCVELDVATDVVELQRLIEHSEDAFAAEWRVEVDPEVQARLDAPPPQLPAAGQFPTHWIYRAIGGIGVRAAPAYPGERTGAGVHAHAEVVVVERLTKSVDGAELTFLKIWVHPDDAFDVERSGGWVFDRVPSGKVFMEFVREVQDGADSR